MKLGARSLSWYIATLVLRAISAGSKSYGPCGHVYVHIVNSYRLVIDTDGWGLSTPTVVLEYHEDNLRHESLRFHRECE
jgi:hypothetical protein